MRRWLHRYGAIPSISYSYEEFIQGLRPSPEGGFELREGIFLHFCKRAAQDPDRPYVFIIDEINRGNLGKIFGELLMLIEHDKRDKRYAVPLAYADADSEPFFVPPNVNLIGLMNTADRSLALVDYALRRRFAFFTLKPQFESPKFRNALLQSGLAEPLVHFVIQTMNDLNRRIAEDKMDLGQGFCIGHSYFTPADGQKLDGDRIRDIFEYEIGPLLQEYWMESPDEADRKIENILRCLSEVVS